MNRLIIILFITTTELLSAQTNSEINNIDQKLNRCLSDSSGIIGQSNCFYTATEDWTNLMKKQYKLLLDVLPKEEKQNLINAQKKWEECIAAETLLSEKIESDYYRQNPTILVYPQLVSERKMNLMKTRAIELTGYCELFSKVK